MSGTLLFIVAAVSISAELLGPTRPCKIHALVVVKTFPTVRMKLLGLSLPVFIA